MFGNSPEGARGGPCLKVVCIGSGLGLASGSCLKVVDGSASDEACDEDDETHHIPHHMVTMDLYTGAPGAAGG